MRTFIDTNVFVYASYLAFPQYSKCREFLRSCLEGSNSWYLSWGVIYEYLSVVTHSKLFSNEVLSLQQAIQNVLRFASAPNVDILQETAEHTRYLEALTEELQPVSGGLLHDAHSVALMREHDLKTICSSDSDFHRFKGIEVSNPLLT